MPEHFFSTTMFRLLLISCLLYAALGHTPKQSTKRSVELLNVVLQKVDKVEKEDQVLHKENNEIRKQEKQMHHNMMGEIKRLAHQVKELQQLWPKLMIQEQKRKQDEEDKKSTEKEEKQREEEQLKASEAEKQRAEELQKAHEAAKHERDGREELEKKAHRADQAEKAAEKRAEVATKKRVELAKKQRDTVSRRDQMRQKTADLVAVSKAPGLPNPKVLGPMPIPVLDTPTPPHDTLRSPTPTPTRRAVTTMPPHHTPRSPTPTPKLKTSAPPHDTPGSPTPMLLDTPTPPHDTLRSPTSTPTRRAVTTTPPHHTPRSPTPTPSPTPMPTPAPMLKTCWNSDRGKCSCRPFNRSVDFDLDADKKLKIDDLEILPRQEWIKDYLTEKPKQQHNGLLLSYHCDCCKGYTEENNPMCYFKCERPMTFQARVGNASIFFSNVGNNGRNAKHGDIMFSAETMHIIGVHYRTRGDHNPHSRRRLLQDNRGGC